MSLQSVSDLLKNATGRTSQAASDSPNPSQNPSIPNSQINQSETPGETPTSQTTNTANTAKSNPQRKTRATRSTGKQGRTTNPDEPAKTEQGIPIQAKDVAAALEPNTHTDSNTPLGDEEIDDDDKDTPQVIAVRDGSKDEAIEQARRTKLALDKAVKAQDDGDDERADFYFTIYHSLLPQKTQPNKSLIQQTTSEKTFDHSTLIDTSFSSTVLPKRPHPDGVTTEVRNLKFKWGVSNDHTASGFAPFFHKNISELKGFLPLTIFNKEWQARALAWNTENRSKVSDEDKGLKYWGLKVPNEYAMSFSDWTLNYTVFYETMRFCYKFETLGQWILLHKANCDKILRKDGFMTALRYAVLPKTDPPLWPGSFKPTGTEPPYVNPSPPNSYDIKIRTNAWQFRPIEDGEEYVSDFSKLKPETYEEAHGEARNNDELQFKTSNPYEIGGPREKWEATTGTRPAKGVQGIPDFRAIAPPTTAAPSVRAPLVNPTQPLPNRPAQAQHQRPGSGYQGNNFNPSYARGNGRQGNRSRE
ncbi:hypothetical protein Pst134EB_018630 [Puccinia striiformis f. sp. tritici]|nr:hypothetical protein Pst134EB_018630 [Puccinia striiformis f. sp. tritici]